MWQVRGRLCVGLGKGDSLDVHSEGGRETAAWVESFGWISREVGNTLQGRETQAVRKAGDRGNGRGLGRMVYRVRVYTLTLGFLHQYVRDL